MSPRAARRGRVGTCGHRSTGHQRRTTDIEALAAEQSQPTQISLWAMIGIAGAADEMDADADFVMMDVPADPPSDVGGRVQGVSEPAQAAQIDAYRAGRRQQVMEPRSSSLVASIRQRLLVPRPAAVAARSLQWLRIMSPRIMKRCSTWSLGVLAGLLGLALVGPALAREQGRCGLDGEASVCHDAGEPDPACDADDCAYSGECTSVAGKCRADLDQDCRRSTVCHRLGRCTPQNGVCVATRHDDCMRSQMCEQRDRCYLDPEEQVCDAGTERNSTAMMVGGIVSMSVGGAGLLAGAAIHALSNFGVLEKPPADKVARTRRLATAVLIGGGTLLAAGIPLLVGGLYPVVREDRDLAVPEVRLGLGGATVGWSF